MREITLPKGGKTIQMAAHCSLEIKGSRGNGTPFSSAKRKKKSVKTEDCIQQKCPTVMKEKLRESEG